MPILRLPRILGVEQGRKRLSVLSINYQIEMCQISSFAGFCCINARGLALLVYRYNRSRLRRLTRLHLQLAAQARLRRVSVLAILSSCIYRPASLTERKVAGLVVAAARSQRYALLLFASVHRETSDDDGNSIALDIRGVDSLLGSAERDVFLLDGWVPQAAGAFRGGMTRDGEEHLIPSSQQPLRHWFGRSYRSRQAKNS
ncbi:hypothetical protein ALC57_17036 [Trachymyrmex cornetzi]|uniref:Uncharacterized protein n=1 Tax=Trachymyrmex cornetzi TaxID=471704 RepID=A0A195DD84_9HYME|nr:hypothetical protein ALC57_17036 [Trachymyrmex cornetzi]